MAGPSAGGAAAVAISDIYRGQVSNRCYLSPYRLTAANATWVQALTRHWAYEKIVNPTVIYPNFWVDASNVENVGGAGTIKVGLQLADGTIVLANQNAAGSVALPNGFIALDFNVAIPPGPFSLRPFVVNANGVVCNTQTNGKVTAAGDGFEYGTGTPVDKSGSGTIALTGGGSFGLFPIAIIASTRRPSVLILGDSIGAGLYDAVSDGRADTGISRLFGQSMPYSNFAISSTSMGTYLSASRTYRDQVINFNGAPIFSHGFNEHGTNDVPTVTAAVAAGRRTSITALYPGIIMGGSTLFPRTTSTDSWATRANQTVATAEIAAFNDLCRAGISGERFVIDIADALDVTRSGLWPVSRDFLAASGAAQFATQDGLHPKAVTYEQVRDRLAGQLSRISR